VTEDKELGEKAGKYVKIMAYKHLQEKL